MLKINCCVFNVCTQLDFLILIFILIRVFLLPAHSSHLFIILVCVVVFVGLVPQSSSSAFSSLFAVIHSVQLYSITAITRTGNFSIVQRFVLLELFFKRSTALSGVRNACSNQPLTIKSFSYAYISLPCATLTRAQQTE